jgi:hypothetical protein
MNIGYKVTRMEKGRLVSYLGERPLGEQNLVEYSSVGVPIKTNNGTPIFIYSVLDALLDQFPIRCLGKKDGDYTIFKCSYVPYSCTILDYPKEYEIADPGTLWAIDLKRFWSDRKYFESWRRGILMCFGTTLAESITLLEEINY